MSGNKNTTRVIILVLLVLAVGVLFYALMGDKGHEGHDHSGHDHGAEQVTDTPLAAIEETHSHDGSEHSHDHAHDVPEGVNIGGPGRVFEMPENELVGIRGIGDPNAPVKIQEFFSLTCNHCATFHTGIFKQLKRKYIDTGKVYFVFEEFPLNGPALYGSMIARCLPSERYADFIGLLLEQQESWAFGGDFRAGLQKNAALAGMSEEDFNACFENEELRKAIGRNIDEAMGAWRIQSTPSFVFNNGERILSGVQSIDSFDAIYNMLMAEGSVSQSTPQPAVVEQESTPEAVAEEPIVAEETIEEAVTEAVEETGDAVSGVIEDASEVIEEAVSEMTEEMPAETTE